MRKIHYTNKFAREYKKLPDHVKMLAERAELIFRKNPFNPSLKTHKLSGRLKWFWSFSVGYKYRIIFEITNDESICFHAIGTHDIYQ